MTQDSAVGAPSRLGIVTAVGVVGATVLGIGINAEPGGLVFFASTLTVAVLWVLGGLAAARSALLQRLAPNDGWRDLLWGSVTGVVLLVAFLVGAGLVARIDFLAGPVDDLLAHARWGSLAAVTVVTTISGIAEEIYFRGALFDVVEGSATRRIGLSTLVYALVTVTSGVALLVFAAVVLGAVTAWLRERTASLVAPIVAHLIWSLGMLYFLPSALDFWR